MSAQEQPSQQQEAQQQQQPNGDVQVRVVRNDGERDSMILLTGLKNIFQKQLPKMPKDYIARLIYDRSRSTPTFSFAIIVVFLTSMTLGITLAWLSCDHLSK